MRGEAERQTNMLLAVTSDSFVARDHPIRRIKPIVDAALTRLSPLLDAMYSQGCKGGRRRTSRWPCLRGSGHRVNDSLTSCSRYGRGRPLHL